MLDKQTFYAKIKTLSLDPIVNQKIMIVPIILHLTGRGANKVGLGGLTTFRYWVSQLFFELLTVLKHRYHHKTCFRFRKKIALTALCVATLVFSSCDSASPTLDGTSTLIPTQRLTATMTPTPTPTPTEVILEGTVTIWHSWNDDDLGVLLQIIDDYKGIHPEVQFDVLYVPFNDLLSRYELSVINGGGPSILIGPDWWGPILFDSGSVADLSSLVEDNWLESFNQAALELVSYRQNLIGLPYSLRGVVLYRNQAIIPTQAETFNDLVSSAQDATAGEIIGAVLERGFFYSGGHLIGLGGRLMDENKQPIFNDQYGLSWLNLLISFKEAGPTEFSSDNDVNLFMENRVGYLIEGTWKMDILAEAIGHKNLIIDPWPTYEGGQLSGFIQSRNLFLNPERLDDTFEVVWEFCKFFLLPEYQLQLAEIGHIPALLDVDVEDFQISQAMVALTGGSPYPTVPEMEIYTSALDNALRLVLFEDMPPDLSLDQATERILDTLSQTHGE